MTDKDNSRFNEDADDNASRERLSRRAFLVAAAGLGAAVEMDAGSAALAQSGSATGTRTPSSGEELVLSIKPGITVRPPRSIAFGPLTLKLPTSAKWLPRILTA